MVIQLKKRIQKGLDIAATALTALAVIGTIYNLWIGFSTGGCPLNGVPVLWPILGASTLLIISGVLSRIGGR